MAAASLKISQPSLSKNYLEKKIQDTHRLAIRVSWIS